MPESELDEVDRKIEEAKEAAREVEQPSADVRDVTPPRSAREEAEEGS